MGHRIGLVRADAGFFEKRFLEYLESQELPYIIVARLTAVVRKLVIHRIPSTAWRVVARGIEVADLEVSLPNWKAAKRRFVCLRQEISERPEARGRRLIDCPGYTYRVMVTSVPYAAEVVSRMPIDPSSCVAYARCPTDFRLRRSWNGLLPAKLQVIPTKSLLPYHFSTPYHPKFLPLDSLYCGIRVQSNFRVYCSKPLCGASTAMAESPSFDGRKVKDSSIEKMICGDSSRACCGIRG